MYRLPMLLQAVFGVLQVMDPVGWTAMKLEWGALWWVAHDEKVLACLSTQAHDNSGCPMWSS